MTHGQPRGEGSTPHTPAPHNGGEQLESHTVPLYQDSTARTFHQSHAYIVCNDDILTHGAHASVTCTARCGQRWHFGYGETVRGKAPRRGKLS